MTSHRIVRTSADLEYWFHKAVPGDTVIYYIGDLAYDRYGFGIEAKLADEIGAMAWEFARTEELHLLQRKLAQNRYEYLAIRTQPRNVLRLQQKLRKTLGASQVDGLIKSTPRLELAVA